MAEIKIVEEAKKPLSMNPRKFALWLFIVSVCMIFASLTSAYIVRQAEGNWFVFQLPQLFTTTTIVIMLSSITMHWAFTAAKKDNFEQVKTALWITAILGLAFLVGQFLAWGKLVEQNVHFVGNPSGSFVYVLSGLHGLHIISGVVVLVVALMAAHRGQIHSKNMNLMELCATYWHFLDVLWLYLFLFMLYKR
jgi:cytochrome c oxidase subunit 3